MYSTDDLSDIQRNLSFRAASIGLQITRLLQFLTVIVLDILVHVCHWFVFYLLSTKKPLQWYLFTCFTDDDDDDDALLFRERNDDAFKERKGKKERSPKFV